MRLIDCHWVVCHIMSPSVLPNTRDHRWRCVRTMPLIMCRPERCVNITPNVNRSITPIDCGWPKSLIKMQTKNQMENVIIASMYSAVNQINWISSKSNRHFCLFSFLSVDSNSTTSHSNDSRWARVVNTPQHNAVKYSFIHLLHRQMAHHSPWIWHPTNRTTIKNCDTQNNGVTIVKHLLMVSSASVSCTRISRAVRKSNRK